MILLLTLLATEWIDLDMTPQEKKETGLVKLSERQKSSLQLWIDRHYEKRSTPIALERTAENPKVSSVEYNGRDTFVHLSDGTCWQICPKDAPIAQGWINPDAEILVQSGLDPEFPHTLTNGVSKSSVRSLKI